MGEQYQLKVTNQSSQPDLKFGLYTVALIEEANGTYPIAWQVKALTQGNHVTFTWTNDFAVVFSARGAGHGVTWDEGGSLDADDGSNNSTLLDYANNDYVLSYDSGAHPIQGGEIYLDTTTNVPEFSPATGPSVALAIATGGGEKVAAIAGNSGPNLQHTFSLHPTYYLQFGNIVQGTMADLKTVTKGQKVEYTGGARYAAYILNEHNQWVKDRS